MIQFDAEQFTERKIPLKSRRLGRTRRAPRATPSDPTRGTRGASLDTFNQLATTDELPTSETCADWLKSSETERDKYRQKLYLQAVLGNTLKQLFQNEGADYFNAERQRDFERVHNCQMEWIAYKADCCHQHTRPVAVPIGCNHRLCPLCNSHRSEKGRARVRKLFPELEHPYLITLTIPNTPHISKADYKVFRSKVREFINKHSDWIRGGVYSIETTFNRKLRTWHIHVHILAECVCEIPTETITYNGHRMRRTTLEKKRMEFSWLRMWDRKTYGKTPRGGASTLWDGTVDDNFDQWLELTYRNEVREWKYGAYQDKWLPADERERRTAWNRDNRRVVDVRRATDGDGAAREVLKYITKVAAFSDDPGAVEEFLTAVKGARLVQTFGCWYGVKLDDETAADDPASWEHLKCECGRNEWVKIGKFFREELVMQPDGRWTLCHAYDNEGQMLRRAGPN